MVPPQWIMDSESHLHVKVEKLEGVTKSWVAIRNCDPLISVS